MPPTKAEKPLLRNKKILLLSPQGWDGLRMSKHHYALELLERGNTVYFVNRPKEYIQWKIHISQVNETPRLFVIQYCLLLPTFFKFHLNFLFQFAMDFQVKRLLRRIGPVDVVWDFDNGNIYPDLSVFGAPIKIFHPVDKGVSNGDNKGADIVFSVSPEILKNHYKVKAPQHFINHGLSPVFESLAMQIIQGKIDISSNPPQTTIGYIGNVAHPAIDRKTCMEVIEGLPNVVFHFFGPYDLLLATPAIRSFIDFLKYSHNVILHGVTSKEEIAEKSINIDLFWACYKKMETYDADNSHKILEYLATGKVVVTSLLSVYEDSPHLIMPDSYSNEALPGLLKKTLANLDHHNSRPEQLKRIQFALSCTYKKQLEKIEKKLQTGP